MADTPEDDQGEELLGLALSGGGARAMAFHLGCLRALDRHGLLARVDTISAVSGGSVIAALYCRHQGSFAAFEADVRRILERGLVGPALLVMLTSLEGLLAAANLALLLVDRGLAFLVRWTIARIVPRLRRWHWLRASPIPRRFSITTILERVFDRALDGATFATTASGRPDLIIVACELQARSAFYFARQASGSWRLGTIAGGPLKLSAAVAASAAYPLLLPSLDRRYPFTRKGGGEATPRRVILTDGGVYDNLGLAPFWPGRQETISLNVRRHARIIACRAGYGLRETPPVSLMPSRMAGVFESLFARSQNLALNRLFDLHGAGAFQAILTPFLDQDDRLITHQPEDYVGRDDVANYPTDFAAMKPDWIDRLARRGEQQVDALLAQYWQAELPKLLSRTPA